MDFISNNLMLIAVALFAFVSLVWPAVRKGMYGIKEVGVAEATQLMSHHDAVVLDVREDSEVAQGQIPKARHIPLGQLSARMGELEKFRDRPLVVNCRSGMRSARACVLLRKNKFEQVYNLAGGIIAWQQANMPVEKP